MGRFDKWFDDKSSSCRFFSLPTDPGKDFNFELVIESFFKLCKFQSYYNNNNYNKMSASTIIATSVIPQQATFCIFEHKIHT